VIAGVSLAIVFGGCNVTFARDVGLSNRLDSQPFLDTKTLKDAGGLLPEVIKITENTVMVRGKVFAKPKSQMVSEVQSNSVGDYRQLAKDTAQTSHRKDLLSKAKKSQTCLCPACLSQGGPCPPHSCPLHHWIGPSCQSCPY